MENRSKITAYFFGAVVVVGVLLAQNEALLNLEPDDTLVAAVTNVLLVYFILALLIERACEVAMDVLTASGMVPAKAPETDAERRMISVLICFIFSLVICFAGLRLIEMVLNLAAEDGFSPKGLFKFVDTLLTTLILAGGSEGIHHVISKLKPNKSEAAETH